MTHAVQPVIVNALTGVAEWPGWASCLGLGLLPAWCLSVSLVRELLQHCSAVLLQYYCSTIAVLQCLSVSPVHELLQVYCPSPLCPPSGLMPLCHALSHCVVHSVHFCRALSHFVVHSVHCVVHSIQLYRALNPFLSCTQSIVSCTQSNRVVHSIQLCHTLTSVHCISPLCCSLSPLCRALASRPPSGLMPLPRVTTLSGHSSSI